MDLGTSGTTIITTLINGQVLTRIEKGKYNIDGYVWDRVKLADGRQGYIAENYITVAGNNTNTTKTELIKVICNSGLKVREMPGTNQKVLTYLDKEDVLTRTEAGVSNVNGYIWDKVVTSTGITGYIARGTSNEKYIEVVENNSQNNNSSGTNNNDDFKLEDNNLICKPNATVETIKEKYSNISIIVKNEDGTIIETGNIGTGYNVTIDKNTYIIIKMGDINGDGKVNTVDALNALKYDVGAINLTSEQLKALDVNKDKKTNTVDALILLKYDVGLEQINI